MLFVKVMLLKDLKKNHHTSKAEKPEKRKNES
jgi:hypothetical protein